MKYSYAFAAALVCLACVSVQAAPPAAQEEAQVLRYDSDVQPESYKFSLDTSDKAHYEEGQLKNVGTDHEAIAVRGYYTYVGDDGKTYTVKYVADENGFQPEGDHLPRAVQ
ncbi:larval cuticle protein 65Ag1 [Drosophila mojavensis]|uniref:Larval cuticle protein 8 n=2 Tax=mojavensis species complex TaxID=198037 RepID=B4KWP0_DROMO|nr:larval cuticle protein 65Ag1 [Drosophila mojavensis]XP_017861153.1 PREDICTED: larval cuticle protein 8-like [Drosophila arizonae]EDW17487.1 uncharacterized protein Dmoj_GI12617 [Drosophila mojavensis]